MRIAVPREIVPGERRVALVPDVVARLVKDGATVVVELGAGDRAGFPDEAYRAAGASIAQDAPSTYADADVVLKVLRPTYDEALSTHEVDMMRPGATLVCFLNPRGDPDTLQLLAKRGVTAVSVELVPRITRAQMMDALSSQSTVAGYKAALLAANAVGRFFPLLMTAAGTIRPSKVLVIGAGVAGLQAIATARRLGAVVEAFDTRPAVKEQVQSLGAAFVELDVAAEEAEDAGGYAKELKDEHIRREKELIHEHATQADAVITTALVPGRRAPVLITEDTVRAMKMGSAIVDLAAEQGGNCELSVPGESVVKHGVTIVAPLHLPSQLAYDASQMYARNLTALLKHLAPKGEVELDFTDEITRAACVTAHGEVRLSPPPDAAPAPREREAKV
ncbi:MAG TPA: Re/Si-specific NAD(P)(+) transhydrogenase subunit alpha [Gemmatimonadaceae bacterium]|nr:Re/Si-specific NAD(P)(+) transhydrogenase subunit alpha [Gemmatimonadaceae bacterium]